MSAVNAIKKEFGDKSISKEFARSLKYSSNEERLKIINDEIEKKKDNDLLKVSLGKIKNAVEAEISSVADSLSSADSLGLKQNPAIQESVKVDTSMKEKEKSFMQLSQDLANLKGISLEEAMQEMAGFPRDSRAVLKGDNFNPLLTIGDILSAGGRAGVAAFSDKPFLESMAEIDPDPYNVDGTLKHWSRRMLEGAAASPSSSIAPFTGFAGLKAASKIPNLAGSMLRQKLGRGVVGGAGATLADMSFDEVTRPEGFPMMTLGDYGLGIGLGAGLGALGGAFNKVTPKSKQAPIVKGSFQAIPQRISNKVDNFKDYGIRAKNFVTGRRAEDPTNIGTISGEVSQGAAPSANNLRVGDEGYNTDLVPFESPTNTALAPNLGPGNTVDGLSTQALENPNNIASSSNIDLVDQLSPQEKMLARKKELKQLEKEAATFKGQKMDYKDLSPNLRQPFYRKTTEINRPDKYIGPEEYIELAQKKQNFKQGDTKSYDSPLEYALQKQANPAINEYKKALNNVGQKIGSIKDEFLKKDVSKVNKDDIFDIVNENINKNIQLKRKIDEDGAEVIYGVNKISGKYIDLQKKGKDWTKKLSNILKTYDGETMDGGDLVDFIEDLDDIIPPPPKSSGTDYTPAEKGYISTRKAIKDLINKKIANTLGEEKGKEFIKLNAKYSKMKPIYKEAQFQLGRAIDYRPNGFKDKIEMSDIPDSGFDDYETTFSKGENAMKRIVMSAQAQGGKGVWSDILAETGIDVTQDAAFALYAGQKTKDFTSEGILKLLSEMKGNLKQNAQNKALDIITSPISKVYNYAKESARDPSPQLTQRDIVKDAEAGIVRTPEFKLIQDFVRMPAKGFPQEEER